MSIDKYRWPATDNHLLAAATALIILMSPFVVLGSYLLFGAKSLLIALPVAFAMAWEAPYIALIMWEPARRGDMIWNWWTEIGPASHPGHWIKKRFPVLLILLGIAAFVLW